EFFLIHLCTHDGILLKRLLSRGQLHNLVYSLDLSQFTTTEIVLYGAPHLLSSGQKFIVRLGRKADIQKEADARFFGMHAPRAVAHWAIY
ncbi:hypothetical protein ABIE59_004058, partial [Marinobacter sp. MBR-99]|uniref:hypothetical protein n=1 Tax=Marinobacter sp. MBR-99 TaxID=3156461 RepID=UPI0033931521